MTADGPESVPLRVDQAGRWYARLDGVTAFVDITRTSSARTPSHARWSDE
ncbi:hypothetical protein [Mycolicibacterium mageritense]|nr:hypothetical protein [Mycolicibacterium mageritense]